MNEHEEKAFQLVYKFYSKWRETVIETEAQWDEFAKDVAQLGVDLDIDNNQLGFRMMCAALDTFNDLYRDGAKPMPAGYFGRDDL